MRTTALARGNRLGGGPLRSHRYIFCFLRCGARIICSPTSAILLPPLLVLPTFLLGISHLQFAVQDSAMPASFPLCSLLYCLVVFDLGLTWDAIPFCPLNATHPDEASEDGCPVQ